MKKHSHSLRVYRRGPSGDFDYFLSGISQGIAEGALKDRANDVVSLRISTFNAARGESKRNWRRSSRDRSFHERGGQLRRAASVHWPGPLLEFLRVYSSRFEVARPRSG